MNGLMLGMALIAGAAVCLLGANTIEAYAKRGHVGAQWFAETFVSLVFILVVTTP